MIAYDNYSSKVVLQLIVAGRTLSLSHVGPSGLVVRGDCEPMPACDADLVISVDESVTVQRIFLPHGIPGPSEPFAYF